MRQLEEENARLKRLVEDLSLDKHMLSEVLQKNLRPVADENWPPLVPGHRLGKLCAGLSVGGARAGLLVSNQSLQGPIGPPLRIRDLAHARPRFGYQRIWVLLRREGWLVNRKRERRFYRLDGLSMRVRRRKPIALHRGPAPGQTESTEHWSIDFVHDTLKK